MHLAYELAQLREWAEAAEYPATAYTARSLMARMLNAGDISTRSREVQECKAKT